ncbi:MAG TPA: Mur ligase family protein [Candidatus Saccharimonadales bacterium]|nr:Mur ligase family protein [Candidatus Saccharimonadales bacterium]
MTQTYAEAERFLYRDLPRTGAVVFTGGRGLERTVELLNRLGNPQEAVRTVHVAGTSGKGSVCYMIDALLRAHGYHTGRFVSPHIYGLTERFAVDGHAISHRELAQKTAEIKPVITAITASPFGSPTFFEAVTAIAFMVNRDHRVEYAVMETGMGGLYDSTNTISRHDKLAVITRLGHDHTAILGRSLRAIATQKAGIIPEDGVVVALRPDNASARRSITETARKRHSELIWVDASSAPSVLAAALPKLIGRHQQENAAVALRAFEYLAARDGFTVKPAAVTRALSNLAIPGRYEQRRWHNHPVILDGAHNLQKITALCDTLDGQLPVKPVAIVAFKEDKSFGPLLRRLGASTASVIITRFDGEVDMDLGAAAPQKIAATARRAGLTGIHVAANPAEAMDMAAGLLVPGQPLVVTGSMYLLGEVAELL